MSSCYKCGKDLPEGQVECEPFCFNDQTSDFRKDAELLQAEAALVQELEGSTANALALAKHLDTMGAAAAKLEIEYEGRRFLVYVKEL